MNMIEQECGVCQIISPLKLANLTERSSSKAKRVLIKVKLQNGILGRINRQPLRNTLWCFCILSGLLILFPSRLLAEATVASTNPEDSVRPFPTPYTCVCTPQPSPTSQPVTPLKKVTKTTPVVGGKLAFTSSWFNGDVYGVKAKYAFVDGLIQSVLGRSSTSAEQGQYQQRLISRFESAGASRERSNLIQTIWNLDEHLNSMAVDYYRRYLRREPTEAEKVQLKSDLSKGKSELQIAETIFSSSEYLLAHPGKDNLVRSIYKDLLGIEPSAPELSYWVEAFTVNSNTSAVVRQLLYSAPVLDTLVRATFDCVLQRMPTTQELQDWRTKLQNKTATPGQLSMALLAMDEFYKYTFAVSK